jgi:outer membrane protein OmpA-like peptidoglycan-associated protein
MKILITIFFFVLVAPIFAQHFIKPISIGIHYSLTDFETVDKIKSSSVSDVLKNKQWGIPAEMMTGFGVDFLVGLTNHIDFSASANYTSGIHAFNLPSTNLINYPLFSLDALLNFKMVSDKYYVRPFLLAGLGVYSQNGTGIYTPVGTGLQFNIFDAAILNIQTQYRIPIKIADNSALFYQIGFATAIAKKKTEKPKVVTPTIVPPVLIAAIEKIKIKNITVLVLDEATLLPLPMVDVKLEGIDTSYLINGITNDQGIYNLNAIPSGKYAVSGVLHQINTSVVSINKDAFNTDDTTLVIKLTHNDPRFTLEGIASDTKANLPVEDAIITLTNLTQNKTNTTISNLKDGNFKMQLEANSDFSISGKKNGFISNIEKISTVGLNRTTTLYVKLQLGISAAAIGQTIVMNKIFFETGKSAINKESSSDLDKLVLFLKDNATIKLEISGHTDNVGSEIKNKALSLSRAKSILDFLVKNSISNERLKAKGYGPSEPISSNETPEGRAQNRRVEIKLIQ